MCAQVLGRWCEPLCLLTFPQSGCRILCEGELIGASCSHSFTPECPSSRAAPEPPVGAALQAVEWNYSLCPVLFLGGDVLTEEGVRTLSRAL